MRSWPRSCGACCGKSSWLAIGRRTTPNTCRSREAAARASVAPATIRVWMAQGRLGRYHAGRELRVRGSELTELMRRPAVVAGIGNREQLTPEKEAELYLRQHRARVAKRR